MPEWHFPWLAASTLLLKIHVLALVVVDDLAAGTLRVAGVGDGVAGGGGMARRGAARRGVARCLSAHLLGSLAQFVPHLAHRPKDAHHAHHNGDDHDQDDEEEQPEENHGMESVGGVGA